MDLFRQVPRRLLSVIVASYLKYHFLNTFYPLFIWNVLAHAQKSLQKKNTTSLGDKIRKETRNQWYVARVSVRQISAYERSTVIRYEISPMPFLLLPSCHSMFAVLIFSFKNFIPLTLYHRALPSNLGTCKQQNCSTTFFES